MNLLCIRFLIKCNILVVFLFTLFPYFQTLRDEGKKFNTLKERNEVIFKITFLTINTVGRQPSDFALVDLVIKKLPEDTLFMMTRLNAHFNSDFVNRARMSTMQGVQVFSPVPFSQYHPDVIEDLHTYEKLDVNRNTGHFDPYNTEHISFYVSDYLEGK